MPGLTPRLRSESKRRPNHNKVASFPSMRLTGKGAEGKKSVTSSAKSESKRVRSSALKAETKAWTAASGGGTDGAAIALERSSGAAMALPTGKVPASAAEAHKANDLSMVFLLRTCLIRAADDNLPSGGISCQVGVSTLT